MSNRKRGRRRRSRRISNRSGLIRCAAVISGAAVFIIIVCVFVSLIWRGKKRGDERQVLPQITMQAKLLEPNEYSRPQISLKKVKGIVVHYTANPGTDAMDNRNYFNNLPKINKGKKKPVYASSHFVIGLTGQIIQCIPLEEIAYASNERNYDTISIECCHPDESGEFTEATYKSMVRLCAWLCLKFDLSQEDVIRHYDVTGKNCPKHFVENEKAWEGFREDIKKAIETAGDAA